MAAYSPRAPLPRRLRPAPPGSARLGPALGRQGPHLHFKSPSRDDLVATQFSFRSQAFPRSSASILIPPPPKSDLHVRMIRESTTHIRIRRLPTCGDRNETTTHSYSKSKDKCNNVGAFAEYVLPQDHDSHQSSPLTQNMERYCSVTRKLEARKRAQTRERKEQMGWGWLRRSGGGENSLQAMECNAQQSPARPRPATLRHAELRPAPPRQHH